MLYVALTVLSATFALSYGAVVNKEVVRTVDASTSVVRVTTTIKAVNVANEYQIAVPNHLATHLAYIAVTSKGAAVDVSAPVM
jgi:hypothetical protein